MSNLDENTQNEMSIIKEKKMLFEGRKVNILLAITVINSILIFVLFIMYIFGNTENKSTNLTTKYPEPITKNIEEQLVSTIKDDFNARDFEKLYNVMGDYAKTQFSYDTFKKSLSQFGVLGKIANTKYIDAKLLQTNNIGKWYQLNYSALYEKGAGSIKINIIVKDNQFEVVGVNFFVDSLTDQ
jgi:hypothetical protein